jgi:hypothetical protein
MIALKHFGVHVGVGTVVGFIAARKLRVKTLYNVSFNITIPRQTPNTKAHFEPNINSKHRPPTQTPNIDFKQQKRGSDADMTIRHKLETCTVNINCEHKLASTIF